MLASNIPGESPPPAPRACFGRDELIEKVIGLAENLTPVALIGVGGIGKTSVALTVLHHHRIKQRFCHNRRFIRCDQFPASSAHLLSRLSKVIGVGIENPEDLASLRPFLSSREIFIILDNAESVLDPEGPDAEEIYGVVEELTQLDNVCLCITSRISAIPSDCETIDVPTLSIGPARRAFYRIYKNAERSDLVDKMLDQLDFHPLSVTLFATVAHQNKWGTDRLRREWERQRTRVLRTMHNKNFATTIELSLSSPMFQELGPDARGLLEVVAFFPQGVDENNVEWLFPTISDGDSIFDKFCVLSLTYRSDSFITMLAPLRDHLCPKDPKTSPLLLMAKERYFIRMSVDADLRNPGSEGARWFTSEDVNVEHLLDVFTAIDVDSIEVWNSCANFTRRLIIQKPRLTVLKPKIEGLPDDHPSKPECLFYLSQLFQSVGNYAERKRLLVHTLKLDREQGNDRAVAQTLGQLSDANRMMGLYKEGIRQVEEALEILERLGDTAGQARRLMNLGSLLWKDQQLDAAEEATSRAINLFAETGEQFLVSQGHRLLGHIYQSKGEIERATHYFEVALGIASTSNWDAELFPVHYDLACLFLKGGRCDDAQAHIERAKLHMANRTYFLGLSMRLQAVLCHRQDRLEQARSEALRAADIFEKLGATNDLEKCRNLVQQIEREMVNPANPDA